MLGVDVVRSTKALHEVERVGLVLEERRGTYPAELVDHLAVVQLFYLRLGL